MVTKVKTTTDLLKGIQKALEPLGGMKAFAKAGEKVFLKPNFNTSDPFPASSDLNFLRAVITLVSGQKPREMILGDSPTLFGNSKKFFEEINAKSLEPEFSSLKVVLLNDEKWIKKEIPKGEHLKHASIPKILTEVDKTIYLPCLKTHAFAQYTGAIKLSVGILKPNERVAMHTGHLQEKIAELSSLIKPDLVIMDARKCFINHGPSEGTVREPNLILASTSRIAIDIEGIKIIQSYPGNSLADLIPEELPQIKRARELGIE